MTDNNTTKQQQQVTRTQTGGSSMNTCPRCKSEYSTYPALSRRDNQTDICSDCGTAEALEDYGIQPPYTGPQYWENPES